MVYGENYQGRALNIPALSLDDLLFDKPKSVSAYSSNVQSKYLGVYPLIIEASSVLTCNNGIELKSDENKAYITLDFSNSDSETIQFMKDLDSYIKTIATTRKWIKGPPPTYKSGLNIQNNCMSFKIPTYKNRTQIDVFDIENFRILPKDIPQNILVSAIIELSHIWILYPCVNIVDGKGNEGNEGEGNSEGNSEGDNDCDSDSDDQESLPDTLYGPLWVIHEMQLKEI